jgi:hypothetical protein
MTRKCGFFDCNNPVEKGSNCPSCKERKENYICSACRQPEPKKTETLTFQESLFQYKKAYEFATKTRDKVPAQLRTEIDQLFYPNLS